MTKPNLIEQARKALEDATPGPWVEFDGDICPQIDVTQVVATLFQDTPDADAELIALAPQMAQALIAAEEVVHSILRSDPWGEVDAKIAAYRKATEAME